MQNGKQIESILIGICIRIRCVIFRLVLWLGAFGSHLPIETLVICAVVINHVVISNPFQLTLLIPIQLLVNRGGPPVSLAGKGTLENAKGSIPLTSSCIEFTQTGLEWCTGPVNFNQTASCCPVISVPQTRVDLHSLLVWETNSFTLVVPEDPNRYTINIPPA